MSLNINKSDRTLRESFPHTLPKEKRKSPRRKAVKPFFKEHRHSSLLKLIIQGFGHLTFKSRPVVLRIQIELKIYDMRSILNLPENEFMSSGQTMLCCIKVCNGLMTHLITFFFFFCCCCCCCCICFRLLKWCNHSRPSFGMIL